jgi:TfoX/Sxy family transcriptional regulator of competence genes
MEWEKANGSMSDSLAALITHQVSSKRLMFGAPVYFVHDNMWTGVKGNTVFLRLSELDRQAIQTDCDEVKPFEPRPDFFMKEYVEIPESKLSDAEFMRKWLDISYDFTKTLPIKVKKEKKKRI